MGTHPSLLKNDTLLISRSLKHHRCPPFGTKVHDVKILGSAVALHSLCVPSYCLYRQHKSIPV